MTTIVRQRPMTKLMSCSTTTMVVPPSFTRRMSRAVRAVSSGFMPATGSSSSMSSGRVASPIAMPSAFWWP